MARTAGAIAACALITLYFLGFHLPAANNGDYWRTTRSMLIWIDIGTAPEACIRFDASLADRSPRTLFALVASLSGRLHQTLRFDCFSLTWWYLALSAVYWTGALASLSRRRGPAVVEAAVHVVVFSLVSGFFWSLYEEALLFALIPWLGAMSFRTPVQALASCSLVALILLSKLQAVAFLPVLIWMP